MFGLGLIKGLLVTLKHFISAFLKGYKHSLFQRYYTDGFMPRLEPDRVGLFTLQYPEEKYQMFPRFRGALMHLRDPETGKPRCIACGACALACPHGVIEVVAEGKGKERKLVDYKYNLGRCIFCRLCVESCRFNAIEMSHEYELSVYDKDLVLHLEDLLRIGDKSGVKESGWAWKKPAPPKTESQPEGA